MDQRGASGRGTIASVAIDRQNPTTVYAGGGSSNQGAFKSTNGGASWTAINNGLTFSQFPLLNVNAMLVDHQNPNIVYAGTFLDGVYKSTNGGASWAEANGTPKNLDGGSTVEMAMDPQNPNVIYAGTTAHLWKTANGGGTWDLKEVGLADKFIFAIAIDPQVPTTVYISTQLNQVYKSVNGGESWQPFSTGLVLPGGSTKPGINALAVDPTNSNIVYAGASPGGVFKSTNAGLTWQQTSQAVLNTVTNAIVIDPVHPNTVYAGTNGSSVFRSTDGGGSWEKISNGMGNLGITGLAISPTGTCVHASTLNGVFDYETQPGGCVPVPVAALLPTSRAVKVGDSATVFATIINPSSILAQSCSIGLVSGIPAIFHYQTTDPNTNALTGQLDTPANIQPGLFQTYVISLTPQQPINATEVQFSFACANTAAAGSIVGVNTLLLFASPTPVPDVIALAATATNDGVVHIPGVNGVGAFAVASVNVGASASITASVDTGGVALPIDLTICMSNPANGQCLVGPAQNVTVPVNANDTPTFSIFVFGKGSPVTFDPAVNRVFVRFKNGGATAGATSVAVTTD